MKTILSILILAAAVLTATAGLQPDGTLNGGTNVVTSLTTNQYQGTIFVCNQTTDVTFEFTWNPTNTTAMAPQAGATFTLDAGLNAANSDTWKSNVVTLWVGNVGLSNAATGLTNLAAGLKYPFFRVGQVQNTNGSGTNITQVKVRCFTKSGI